MAATVATFALPLAAQAEYLVPPGNSAATQYTEAVPTASGPKAGAKSNHNHQAESPDKVLGSRNAARLEAQGPQGQAAAEVAAATAPLPVAASEPSTSAGGKSGQAEKQGAKGGSGGGGGSPSQSGNGAGADEDTGPTPRYAEPNGSSGFGEVLGQATGSSSSGQLGLLLPLIVLATVAWAVAYVLHQRKRPTP